jgi:Dolichyl-phosphate-mannose-protein mannosyltransferase
MKNEKWKIRNGKWIVFLGLLIVAGIFRIAVAHWLPNDSPDDAKTYARIARNVLEQHSFSDSEAAPYEPTLIRLPGYPLFLAAIYKVFGHGNNGAVRIVQALIDTATCGLVALLAFYWQPDEKRKRVTALAALALAAICPFTTIYAATILSEVPSIFLALAACVAATIAFQSDDDRRSLKWWCAAGLLAGFGTMFRPDSGLFFAALGLVLVVTALVRLKERWRRTVLSAAAFSLTFALVLAPWTIRNWRVFHLFQPLAPMYAEMPDEFVPRGYIRWLKTWLDNQQYIDPFWWELDVKQMSADDLPDEAFDSDAERDRVVALIDQYNHPAPNQAANVNGAQPQPQSSPTPNASPTHTPTQAKTSVATPTPAQKNQTQENANSNANDSEDSDDENDQNDNSSDQSDEKDNAEGDQSDQSKPEEGGPVKMTPAIDAAFGQIADERIARYPLRYYVLLPAKKAHSLWFNTHSDFYPFEGSLLPWSDLDHGTHQQIWLPLFAALVGMYTLLGVAGGFVLFVAPDFYAKAWVLLVGSMIVGRLVLISTFVSPEPRYVVAFFPFLAVLGGLAIARVWKRAE